MIKPTVGRVVWYWPTAEDIQCRNLSVCDTGPQPFAATIACVHSDRRVALSVVDHAGKQFGLSDVMLLQVSDDGRAAPGYAQWMPYQKGQAAKTEALAAKIDAQLFGRVGTPADIEANIASEHYFTAADGQVGSVARSTIEDAWDVAADAPLELLTFCVLVLRNGFTVTGESAFASPENFDAEVGRKIARKNAIEQIWPLEGYLLRQRLYEQEQDAEQMLVAEVEAGQIAAEALIDHLEAMGDPASVEIPVSRNGRSFKVKVLAE